MPVPRAYRGDVSVNKRDRGQSAVELALTLPILLLLVLGIVDFGRVFVAANVLTHATGDAARYGSVNWRSANGPGSMRDRVIQEAARSSVTITHDEVDVLYLDANGTDVIGCWPFTADDSAGAYSPTGPGNGCGFTGACPRLTCDSPSPGDMVQVKSHLPWSAETSLIQNVLPAGFTINSSAASVIEQ
ncbi:MAG: hypothetical protein QOK05_504 [Chloroflexota bacterium]|nr:hypothetical protein [Chloroflexota bacterium]